MVEGYSKFDPLRFDEGPPNPMNPPQNGIDRITEKINAEIYRLREWGTLQNILGYNAWTDPLTGDVHIVIKAGKMLNAKHIGDAAECIDGQFAARTKNQ